MLQAVVAVGASGEDLFDVIPFKRLEVLFYEHGIQVLVARPSRRVTATSFFWARTPKEIPTR